MMRKAAVFAAVPVALGAVHTNRNFLGADMRPDVVAHTLVRVENGWMKDATQFAHCTAEASDDCAFYSQAFSKSCVQVVSGVVQGSSGDRERTQEYMADVCGQNALAGWHKATCLSLRSALSEKMTESSFDNRESMDVSKICQVAWASLVEEQKVVVKKEMAERKEVEKKEQEEAAKEEADRKAQQKKTAEAAIKKAQAAEDRAEAKEKEMKQEEEEKKTNEVQEKKSEDDKFQKTKEQIEAVERAADQKMAEATAVEREDVSATTPVKPAAKATPAVVKVAAAPKPAAAKATPAVVKVAAAAKPAEVAGAKLKAAEVKEAKAAAVNAEKPVVVKAVKAPVPVKDAKATAVKPAVAKPKA